MTGFNKDVLAGKWKQATGKAKLKWGKLTDDEIARSNGRADVLAGLIQERYGKARAEAEDEVKKFLNDCGCA
jgi:uncharacterized protein YjbJ (UPF0337 family)